MKKIIALLLCLLVSVAMFSGCGDAKEPQQQATAQQNEDSGNDTLNSGEKALVRFMVGGSAGELEQYEMAVDAFNEQSDTTTVELIGLPGDGYNEKILTQLSSQTPPDCFYSEEATFGELNNSDALYDLSAFLDEGAYGLSKSDIPESLLQFCTHNEKVTGVPVDCNPMVIYYNVELFDQLGIKSPQQYYDEGTWNFAALQEVSEQLQLNDKVGFVYENWWGPLYSFLISSDTPIYEGNVSNFDDERMLAGLTFLNDNIVSGAFVNAGSITSGESPDMLFISGQAGMIYAGRWFVPDFKEIGFVWDVVPFPYFENPEDAISPMPSTPMVINKNSENPEAVWEFISFYCGKPGQQIRMKDAGNAVPTVPGLDEIVLTGTPEHAQYFLDALEVSFSYPREEATHPGLTDSLTEEVEKMLIGDQGPQEALANMKAAADEALSK